MIKLVSTCNIFNFYKGVDMSKKMNKKITRRSMLKSTTALAGAAIGSGLITGSVSYTHLTLPTRLMV